MSTGLELAKRLPQINGQEPLVCLRNDAVVQGFSQLQFMQDTKHWAVLTVGTGLGNARRANRARSSAKSRAENRTKSRTTQRR